MARRTFGESMNLSDPVDMLKGIGEKTAATLKKYGIYTVRDLFYNLPRDYENYQKPTSIAEIHPGKVVIRGKIKNLTSRRARRRNMSITEGEIHDSTGSIRVVWFNQGYRAKQFSPDKEYLFTGNFDLKNGRYTLVSPSTAEVAEIDPYSPLMPVYVAHGTFSSNHFRRIMNDSRDKFTLIPDLLPTVKTGTRARALFSAHFPSSVQMAEKAREYLAYEELFELILAARLNKQENQKLQAPKIPFKLAETKDFLNKLPFTLTGAQKRAAWEIFQDIEKVTPMNRLLQGDVGSGKTIVAALATYMASLGGVQVALLAPTAILATQHFKSLEGLLKMFNVKSALLTGATKQKTELKEQICQGKINVIIGTHAILTDDTVFNNLGLVIIDEQHRFGVEQRQKIMLKSPDGTAPHLLAMTATPIPRSLQLTVFGDLDVSVLSEMPKGRQPVKTTILKEIETREKLYPHILDAIRNGQQVYWISKAIDDDPHSETTSVKTRAAKLSRDFPEAKVEFLHGRMKPAEKDEIMERFSRGETQILVSTTVVEVGVDVPNATLIAIENSERYGLAQLHQLRGRVGRGKQPASCYLITSGEMQPSRRLKELEKSNDGFYLAEVDLKMRGPGEIYGVLQHGALDLKIASFSDAKLIRQAQKDVMRFLQNPENMIKYKELMNGIHKYQQITTLN